MCEKLQQPIEKAWYTWNLYDFIYEQYANQRPNKDFADPHIRTHTVTDGLMNGPTELTQLLFISN